MAAKFTYLRSDEPAHPTRVWQWAKRLVDDLNKLRRLWDLAEADLTGKGGMTVKVKADESGFEIVP
jgi:hypothetical protein